MTGYSDVGLVGPGQFAIIGNHVASTDGENHDHNSNWGHNDGVVPWRIFDAFNDLLHLGRWIGFDWLWRHVRKDFLGLVNHLDKIFPGAKVFVPIDLSIWDTLAVSRNSNSNFNNKLLKLNKKKLEFFFPQKFNLNKNSTKNHRKCF